MLPRFAGSHKIKRALLEHALIAEPIFEMCPDISRHLTNKFVTTWRDAELAMGNAG